MSPDSSAQLTEMMAMKNVRREKISAVDLRQLNRVLELTPEDMTVTVEAGISLGALQRQLAEHRQWLPIDPPHADRVSVHEVLSTDLSGPRRFGYGSIREHLIGLRVMLADGRSVKSGGKVVKNVAGYDLAKLFIGTRDSLGVITEATFKLRPLPETERFVCKQASDLAEAKEILRAVLNSELTSVVLDACRSDLANSSISIILGFAGTRAEVDWQLSVARALGFEVETNLDYETDFWSVSSPVNRLSVLPSRATEVMSELGARAFVARAGNGVIYFRGEAISRQKNVPLELTRRVKTAFDPQNILPELTA